MGFLFSFELELVEPSPCEYIRQKVIRSPLKFSFAVLHKGQSQVKVFSYLLPSLCLVASQLQLHASSPSLISFSGTVSCADSVFMCWFLVCVCESSSPQLLSCLSSIPDRLHPARQTHLKPSIIVFGEQVAWIWNTYHRVWWGKPAARACQHKLREQTPTGRKGGVEDRNREGLWDTEEKKKRCSDLCRLKLVVTRGTGGWMTVERGSQKK